MFPPQGVQVPSLVWELAWQKKKKYAYPTVLLNDPLTLDSIFPLGGKMYIS